MNNIEIIEKIFLKTLVATDDFKFIYDEKDVGHSNPNRSSYFYNNIKRELKNNNLIYEEAELKKIWSKIREKFVKINLLKIRFSKVSKKKEKFYNNWIFLEDYVSHKHNDVYKTPNKKEIIEKVYDEVMGNTYVNNVDENDASDNCVLDDDNEVFNLDDFPDLNADLNNTDAQFEAVEILEGYENIVHLNLIKEKKNSEIQKKAVATAQESISISQLKNSEIHKKSMKAQESAVTVQKPIKGNIFPLASIISPLEANRKTEMEVGSCRSKHEQLINNKREALVNQIAKVLNEAVIEKITVLARSQTLQLILNSIKTFCNNSKINE